jgi:hypothetical protein
MRATSEADVAEVAGPAPSPVSTRSQMSRARLALRGDSVRIK